MLVFASIAAVVFILVLPAVMAVLYCKLKKRQKAIRVDPKRLTNIVTVDGGAPAEGAEGAPPLSPALTASRSRVSLMAGTVVDAGTPRGAGVIPREDEGAPPVRTDVAPTPRGQVKLNL